MIRGNLESGEFSAWYIDGGTVAGALSVGRSDDLVHARTLIETSADVSGSKDALADRRFGARGDRAVADVRAGRSLRLRLLSPWGLV